MFCFVLRLILITGSTSSSGKKDEGSKPVVSNKSSDKEKEKDKDQEKEKDKDKTEKSTDKDKSKEKDDKKPNQVY